MTVLNHFLRTWNSPETWQVEHQRAMTTYMVQDLIRTGMFFHAEILRMAQSEFPQNSREIAECCRSWLKPCPEILKWIEELKHEGYQVEGAEAFLDAYLSLIGVDLDFDRTARVVAQLDAGQGIPIREAFDAIRNRNGG